MSLIDRGGFIEIDPRPRASLELSSSLPRLSPTLELARTVRAWSERCAHNPAAQSLLRAINDLQVGLRSDCGNSHSSPIAAAVSTFGSIIEELRQELRRQNTLLPTALKSGSHAMDRVSKERLLSELRSMTLLSSDPALSAMHQELEPVTNQTAPTTIEEIASRCAREIERVSTGILERLENHLENLPSASESAEGIRALDLYRASLDELFDCYSSVGSIRSALELPIEEPTPPATIIESVRHTSDALSAAYILEAILRKAADIR